MPKMSKISSNKGTNLLFDPQALKSSGLFKKLTDKQDNQEENVITTVTKNEKVLANKIEVNEDPLFSLKKQVTKEVKKEPTLNEEDLFENKATNEETKYVKETEEKADKKAEISIEDENLDDLFKPMKSNTMQKVYKRA